MCKIEFFEKFTAKDFPELISLKYNESLGSEKVLFDLERIEWISLEGITFLFGWINKIKSTNDKVKVNVILPNPNIIESDYIGGVLDPKKSKRRERRLINLIEIWQFRLFCDIKSEDIINPPSYLNKLIDERRKRIQNYDSNWQQILPFRKIDANIYNEIQNVRNNLDDQISDIFSFEEDVNYMLNRFSTITPFKNKTLSHLITIELLLNTLHHSGVPKNKPNECFFSISLNKRFNYDDIMDEIEKKQIENYIDEHKCSYYEAKKHIPEISGDIVKLEYSKRIKNRLSRNIESERPKYILPFFKDEITGQYLNRSYIEFTFLDFGIGIPDTLRNDYSNKIQDKNILSRLSKQHSNASLESRILEYSFLLDSSRNSFIENLGIQGFVPRGLYFLLDIVRLYCGLIVVKSGKGEIVFDFSKTQDVKEAVNLIKNEYLFPGTLINILIPEQENIEVKLQPIQELKTISTKPAKREYLSIIDIYRKFQERYDSDKPFESIDLYNYFFIEINTLLDKIRNYNDNTILYLDFAGASLSYLDYKIFYFLVNTPKVNQNTNLVLLNITNKNLLNEVRNSLLSFEPFIFRPIPCIIEELDGINVSWIGIKHLSDERKLTELLKFENYTLSTSDFESPELLTGNVIEVNWLEGSENHGNIQRSTFLPSIQDIEYVNNELLNQKLRARIISPSVKDEDILLQPEDSVFLTSGGYYQYKFIKFIDLLFNKDSNNRAFSERIAINLLNKWRYKCGSIPCDLDWIITVTLSSQMLGRDVKKVYQRLLELDDKKKQPKLLKLAHYYEFSNEIGFEKIEKGQKVLVVNDVISTGSLNYNLYKSLTERKANVVAFFAIVDCRLPDDQINIEQEKRSIYMPELDAITITLVDNLGINKYLNNLYGAKNVIKINPIINAPTTMELQHSERVKIVYPEIRDVLIKIKPEHLLIGYFRNNKSHHTYFPNTENIFLEFFGKEFLRDLIKKVLIIEKERNIEENKDDRDIIVDFVFYPVFSGIEAFEDYHFQQYFGNSKLRSYPIPRIDTVKGWRFTFPPKILNKITEHKTVFILDDGSCSGETILQMIDSICFLDVKKIIVLSVFGRLEDFQREFFSRIKRMKVKNLKNIEKDENIEPIIDTHIYFGTHLNIHHFPYEKSTSFLLEHKELELLSLKHKQTKIPELAEIYIKKRLKELTIIDIKDFDLTNYNPPNHFPLIRNENKLDIRNIYEIRNTLGKLDSYRIYKEYYKGTDFQDVNDLELIIGIVNHEPHILETIKHLLPDVFKRLDNLIKDIVFKNKLDSSNLFYSWNTESLLRFLLIIDYSILHNDKKLLDLLKILERIESNEGFSFIMFHLWKEIIGESKHSTKIENTILKIWHKLYISKEFKTRYYKIISNLIDKFQYKEVKSVEKAFYNLFLFYSKEASNEHHRQLEQVISNILPSLSDEESNNVDIPELNLAVDGIRVLIKKNLNKLYESDFIKDNFPLIYSNLFENDDSIYKRIENVQKLSNDVIFLNSKVNSNIEVKEEFHTKKWALYESIKILNSQFLDIDSSFAQFCLKYYSNPKEIWCRIVNGCGTIGGYSNVNFNLQDLDNMSDIFFPIHSNLLEKVFVNIIHNICEKAKEGRLNISYIIECNKDLLIFSVEQDKHFNIENNQVVGKGIQQIKSIISESGGNIVLPKANSGQNMYYQLFFTKKNEEIWK